jgi:hypothetical protein
MRLQCLLPGLLVRKHRTHAATSASQYVYTHFFCSAPLWCARLREDFFSDEKISEIRIACPVVNILRTGEEIRISLHCSDTAEPAGISCCPSQYTALSAQSHAREPSARALAPHTTRRGLAHIPEPDGNHRTSPACNARTCPDIAAETSSRGSCSWLRAHWTSPSPARSRMVHGSPGPW